MFFFPFLNFCGKVKDDGDFDQNHCQRAKKDNPVLQRISFDHGVAPAKLCSSFDSNDDGSTPVLINASLVHLAESRDCSMFPFYPLVSGI